MTIIINFAKISDDATIPKHDTNGVGYNIYPYFPQDYMIIPPHSTRNIPTGIIGIAPSDYYFQIYKTPYIDREGLECHSIIDDTINTGWDITLTNTNSVPVVISKDKPTDHDIDTIYIDYYKPIAKAVVLYKPSIICKEISLEQLQKLCLNDDLGVIV